MPFFTSMEKRQRYRRIMTLRSRIKAGKMRSAIRSAVKWGMVSDLPEQYQEYARAHPSEFQPKGKTPRLAKAAKPTELDPSEGGAYPDFKPARDPVPAGVKWAMVVGERKNIYQKVIRFEGDDLTSPLHTLWVTRKQASTRLLGRTFPCIENPDTLQGGWVIWRRT